MKLLYQTHSPYARKALVFAHEAGIADQIEVIHHETSPLRRNEEVFAANPLGFHDLGGNVAEWTTDLYTVQPPAVSVAVDPLAGAPGNVHVIRGSSFMHSTVMELRATFRDYGGPARPDLGFRVARSSGR